MSKAKGDTCLALNYFQMKTAKSRPTCYSQEYDITFKKCTTKIKDKNLKKVKRNDAGYLGNYGFNLAVLSTVYLEKLPSPTNTQYLEKHAISLNTLHSF